ncbi:hypothetical protein BDV39DRAFT_169932 [Aspergillus sergii]|uniref:Uncharacterized protein n=1 Tax=Aspergillus sergii TaxID=1034303 RepID=A0A5N6XBU9_9EURO|nr:hypothetical protein BDV39DRAFT_169932 [Aspergillus sergii]
MLNAEPMQQSELFDVVQQGSPAEGEHWIRSHTLPRYIVETGAMYRETRAVFRSRLRISGIIIMGFNTMGSSVIPYG